MNYTLAWSTDAQEQLTELWMAASNKRAVTDATVEVDRLLMSGPRQVGERLRDGEYRFLVVPPLTVFYAVHEDIKQIEVWAVWPARMEN